jgi:hypothetical protein
MLCKQHVHVPSSASTESGRGGLLNSVCGDTHARMCERYQIFGEGIHDYSRDPSIQRCFVYISFCVVFPMRRVLLFVFRRPFEGLHCVQLSTSTYYDYIEYTHEMSRVNGATDTLSIGPSVGYILFFVFVHVLLLFIANASIHTCKYMSLHISHYFSILN